MRRRSLLCAVLSLASVSGSVLAPAVRAWAASRRVAYPAVRPGQALVFPRDHGAHPEYRGEWWYVTGWLRRLRDGAPLGFQVTFFRVRLPEESDNPSRFAPTQLLIAHAALADPERGRLRVDQRIARVGFGLAAAETDRTDVRLDDWSLVSPGGGPGAGIVGASVSGAAESGAAESRAGASRAGARASRTSVTGMGKTHDVYRVAVPARDFDLQLVLDAQRPPLAHGEDGFSRKSPHADSASYYYSRPHLRVTGEVATGAVAEPVEGSAWLDHEWWSTFLDEDSVGWDWVGANLDGGGALMAMRIRDRAGETRWTAATVDAAGVTRRFGGGDVSFSSVRVWRSPRTGADYPVEVRLRVGGDEWRVVPLFDDQELDSRATTGAVYWEGAVRLLREGREAGRGYLEMTGYLAPMRF